MSKIKHIAIFSEDPDRLAQFYVDVFGMRITHTMKGSEESGDAVFITDGYVDVALIRPNEADFPRGINHFGFTLDAADRSEILGRLKERGIEPRTPPRDRPYVEDAIYDIDGNKVDLSTTGMRI